MIDSILINTPISSPLHIQANLPLIKGYLKERGFESMVVDSNILFFHWFLGEKDFNLTTQELYENPLSILSSYNDIESKLWKRSQDYAGLHIGMRSLNMKYDRTLFEEVLLALDDSTANPFIEFYDRIIDDYFVGSGVKLACIAVTFQDQIIPAFTLARRLRSQMPSIKIVFGGQMVTRCHDTMVTHQELSRNFDYLCLWEGEKPLFDIHRKEINGESVELVNAIEINKSGGCIDRERNAPDGDDIPASDFSDIDFNNYFFPEMLIPLQTTRGCYGKCEFCAIPYGANSYRMRKLEAIIDEIIAIQNHTLEKYGKKATFFKFMEDTSSPALLFDLAVEIEKKGLDVKWETFARLEKAFTKEGVMDQLFRGGCRKIHWGLESNDPNILKNMNKKITNSYSNQVLALSAQAGILNFCFVLVGFPGETDVARRHMAQYIIDNENIHTITISTFDLTRGSRMQQNFDMNNPYKLEMAPAVDFQVRLPYMVDGQNWKADIIPKAHRMMYEIVEGRPDIGLMTLFPDQVRAMFCDKYSNKWGSIFVEKYGEESIKEMLTNTEKYLEGYGTKHEIDPAALPEPLRREHFRTKEDLKSIAAAIISRKNYEQRRTDQV